MTFRTVGELITKAKIEKCGDSKYPVLSMTMHDGIVFQDERFKKQIASIDQSTYNVVHRNQLVVSFPIDEGVLAVQDITDAGIVSPAYKIWDVDQAEVIPKYLEMFLRSPHSIQYYKSKLRGSTARRRSITDADLLGMEIPLGTKDEQTSILNILELTKRLINIRKQELAKLDELIKARFVEMFVGKDYPLILVDDLSLGKGEYGAQSASIEYDPCRPRYVRITDINEDGTLNDDLVSSSNEEDDEQYKLRYGDFLFARMGATVGKTYAYRGGNQIYAGYLIRYKLNLDWILPEYLYAFTKQDEYWNWVKLNQSGAAQPGINAKKYGSLRVPVPPLSEQKVFQTLVHQVDKSKSRKELSYKTEKKLAL